MASKAYMAREGLWYGLDAALTWHPGDSSEVTTGSTNSCIQMIYTFHGLASQASTAPERGRSALDAVELMNVGVQFLREHMPRDARVHYSILDAGGVSPNVVQHQASVLYMIRSNFVKDCMALHQRVDKIAQGAALMTDTTIERRFVDGLSDTVCNHALEKLLYDNFAQLGVPPCTAEEHAFMEALSATYEGRDVPGGVGAENDPAFAEKVKAMQTGHFNDFLMPLYQGPAFNAGSTDVGDVSYQCPTAQIHVAVWPNNVPCHSWQVVSCNKTPMAHKATVHAGKVLCAAAIDLLEQPALLEAAKAEFRQRTAAGYNCPIRRTPCRRPSSCKERTPLTCRSGVFSYRCSSFSRRKLRLASSRPSAASTSAAAPSTQVSVSVSPGCTARRTAGRRPMTSRMPASSSATSTVEFSQLSIFFMASSPAPERPRRFRPPSYHPPHSPSRAESRGLSSRAVPGFAFTPAGRGRCRILTADLAEQRQQIRHRQPGFSSPEISSTIRPLCSISRRLP